jgi:hypothetical protein
MVTDQRPHIDAPGFYPLAVHLQAYGTVRVLEIRRGGPGAEVDPMAYHAVTHEAIVTLVRVSQEHGGGNLAPDPAFRPENRSPDEAAEHFGTHTHVCRAFKPGPAPDL